MNQLCAPTTYFRKTAGRSYTSAYTTWVHPGRKSVYQLDHFFVKQRDLKLVRDAGAWDHGVESDHRAIHLNLELTNTVNMPSVRKARVDRGLLQDSLTRCAWHGSGGEC